MLFMDDDDYAEPHQLRTFASVAGKTNADILTCGTSLFESLEPPDISKPPWRLRVFPGAAIAAGAAAKRIWTEQRSYQEKCL